MFCSKVWPIRHNKGSERCFPTNWMPRGSPSLFCPQGKEIVGEPLKSNGTVNRPQLGSSNRNMGPYIFLQGNGVGRGSHSGAADYVNTLEYIVQEAAAGRANVISLGILGTGDRCAVIQPALEPRAVVVPA